MEFRYFRIYTPNCTITLDVPKQEFANSKDVDKSVIEYAQKYYLQSRKNIEEISTESSVKEISKKLFEEELHIQKHLDRCLR